MFDVRSVVDNDRVESLMVQEKERERERERRYVVKVIIVLELIIKRQNRCVVCFQSQNFLKMF